MRIVRFSMSGGSPVVCFDLARLIFHDPLNGSAAVIAGLSPRSPFRGRSCEKPGATSARLNTAAPATCVRACFMMPERLIGRLPGVNIDRHGGSGRISNQIGRVPGSVARAIRVEEVDGLADRDDVRGRFAARG